MGRRLLGSNKSTRPLIRCNMRKKYPNTCVRIFKRTTFEGNFPRTCPKCQERHYEYRKKAFDRAFVKGITKKEMLK